MPMALAFHCCPAAANGAGSNTCHSARHCKWLKTLQVLFMERAQALLHGKMYTGSLLESRNNTP